MRRRKPLRRKSGLKRTALARGGALRRKPPEPRTDLLEAAAWYRAVVPRGKAPCPVCGSRALLEGHHVLRQQHLSIVARRLGVEESVLWWDVRAGLPLCSDCHERHTNASRRVPRRYLTVANWAFARDYDLVWLLEKEYPK